jgi:DNA repair protein SbcC/Rad50
LLLTEYALRRYGPLPDSGKLKLGTFNLFFGANEDGKTLTIDALLKILFGKAAVRSFQAIKRVEEQPDGYVVLQLDDRREVKLPEAGSLPDLLGISAAEFTNIFIIRDSNLAIANEDQFYRGVTNRLTGMRSGEIKMIIDELRDLGQVTNTGDYKNTAPDKLKDRLSKARHLMQKGNQLAEKMLAEGYTGFEEELAALTGEREDCRNRLKLQREAANREKYETGLGALARLKEAELEMEQLNRVTEADYDEWRKTELKHEHINDERKRLTEEHLEIRNLLESARSELLSAKLAHREAEQELKKVAGGVEADLEEYDRQQLIFCRWETLAEKSILGRLFAAGFIVFLMTLAGSIYRPYWWLYILLGLASAAVLLALTIYFFYLHKKSRLKEAEAVLLVKAASFNLAATEIYTLRRDLGSLTQKVAALAGQLSEAEKSLEWRQKEFDRLKNDLEVRARQAKETEADIKRIQNLTGADNLEALAKTLKLQQNLHKNHEKEAGILESHFGKGDQQRSPADLIFYWESQIDSLSPYVQAAPGVMPDRKEVAQLNETLGRLEEKIQGLTELTQERKDELRSFEKEVDEIFNTAEDDDLRCETTADLKMILKKLEEWTQTCEELKDAALAAISLFEMIEQEEEQKVSELFGSESPVSSYFDLITGGFYHKVSYDTEQSVINIIRKDGLQLKADQLSGGAFDQLYFAIRLALGEKLLQGEKGFFILDDPFIKADPNRLKILISMLFKIVADGWQILYFSSKGEIRQILEEKIAAGEVKQVAVNPAGVQ